MIDLEKEEFKKGYRFLMLTYILVPVIFIYNIVILSTKTSSKGKLAFILLAILTVISMIVAMVSIRYDVTRKKYSAPDLLLTFINFTAVLCNFMGIYLNNRIYITLSLVVSFYILYIVIAQYLSNIIKKITFVFIFIISICIGIFSIYSFRAYTYNNLTYINTQKEIPSNIEAYLKENALGSPSLVSIYKDTMSIQLPNFDDKTIAQVQKDSLSDISAILMKIHPYYPRINKYVFYATSTPHLKGNVFSATVNLNELENIGDLNSLSFEKLNKLSGLEFYPLLIETKKATQNVNTKMLSSANNTTQNSSITNNSEDTNNSDSNTQDNDTSSNSDMNQNSDNSGNYSDSQDGSASYDSNSSYDNSSSYDDDNGYSNNNSDNYNNGYSDNNSSYDYDNGYSDNYYNSGYNNTRTKVIVVKPRHVYHHIIIHHLRYRRRHR